MNNLSKVTRFMGHIKKNVRDMKSNEVEMRAIKLPKSRAELYNLEWYDYEKITTPPPPRVPLQYRAIQYYVTVLLLTLFGCEHVSHIECFWQIKV